MAQTFALATDDVMLFTVASQNACGTGRCPGKAACDRLHKRIHAHGIQPSPEKDINGQANATVIGIGVADGKCLAPSNAKKASVMVAMLHLWMTNRSSVLLSWVCLRGLLS